MFKLFSICVDLIQFLTRANFENVRSPSQYVNGIFKYNVNGIYTSGKALMRFRS